MNCREYHWTDRILAPKIARHLTSSPGGHETKLALLTRERDEALARQAATCTYCFTTVGAFSLGETENTNHVFQPEDRF